MTLPCSHGSDKEPTVHQVLLEAAPAYLHRFGASMPARHRQVLDKMVRCRTAALGGQLFRCQCGTYHFRFHSCNDRFCPQCGQSDAEEWLARQKQRLLLPVPYFLVTFTVPEGLRHWMRSHQQLAYDLLFAASSQALQDLASNPKRLGAQLGLLGVLHTWSRTLAYHPHVHYLVPGGGLSLDQRQWVDTRQPGYLLHARALADRCRNLMAEHLPQHYPEDYKTIPAQVWKQQWVVDCKAVGSGEGALVYLSRYVFKTATGNRRVQRLANGQVRWPYRDSKTGRWTHVDLSSEELLRRYLQHVLPKSFTRVRLFGWFHPAARQRLNKVRALLAQKPVLSAQEKQTWLEETPASSAPATNTTPSTPKAVPLCARCEKPMTLVGQWRAGTSPLAPWEQRSPP